SICVIATLSAFCLSAEISTVAISSPGDSGSPVPPLSEPAGNIPFGRSSGNADVRRRRLLRWSELDMTPPSGSRDEPEDALRARAAEWLNVPLWSRAAGIVIPATGFQ